MGAVPEPLFEIISRNVYGTRTIFRYFFRYIYCSGLTSITSSDKKLLKSKLQKKFLLVGQPLLTGFTSQSHKSTACFVIHIHQTCGFTLLDFYYRLQCLRRLYFQSCFFSSCTLGMILMAFLCLLFASSKKVETILSKHLRGF